MAGLNTSTPAEAPWYAAYPPPRTTAASLSRGKLLQWLQNKKQPGRDFILVDLRRTDFEVGVLWMVMFFSLDRRLIAARTIIGRNHPRIPESPGTESVRDSADLLRSSLQISGEGRCVVLRYSLQSKRFNVYEC